MDGCFNGYRPCGLGLHSMAFGLVQGPVSGSVFRTIDVSNMSTFPSLLSV